MTDTINGNQQPPEDKLAREITYYLNRCKASNLSQISISTYQKCLDYFHWWCSNQLGELDPGQIDEDAINQFVAYLKTPLKARWGEDIRPGKERLSMASVGTYFRCVRVFFNYLELKKKIDRSPIPRNYTVTSKKDPIPNKYQKSLEEEQLSKIFAFLTSKEELNKYNGVRNLALISLLLDSGMRKGEILSITVGDFDWSRGRVEIRGKTGPRTCFFSESTEQALTDYVEKHRKAQNEYSSPNSPFWLTSDSHPLSVYGFQSLMEKMVKYTGVKFSAHKFRHTFASLLVSKVGIYEVKELLGHSSIQTTEIYLHSNANRIQKSYKTNAPLDTLSVGQLNTKSRRGRPPKRK